MPRAVRFFAGAILLTALLMPMLRSRSAAAEGGGVLGSTAVGNYLAGRHAQARHDLSTAADFLGAALKDAPEAPDLLRRTFLLMAMEGRIEDALPLARRVVQANPKAQIANIVLAADDIKRRRFRKVLARLEPLENTGVGIFTFPLLSAWALAARKQYDDALKTLEPLNGKSGSRSLLEFHSAILNDVAGRRAEALKHYTALAVSNGKPTLRLTQLLGGLLERMGEREKARDIYDTYIKDNPDSRLFESALRRVKRGRKPKPFVRTAVDGAAEALFSIASSLSQQRVRETGLVLGQMALYLKPDFPITQVLVGDLMEADNRLERANNYYLLVDKNSDLAWSARLRVASNLNRLDREEDAILMLKQMAKEASENSQPLIRMGDILRNHERYIEAARAYDDAVERIGSFEPRHWSLLYTRGIVLERLKQWSRAEADLKQALEFMPDQPYVLNYLGYSWIEQGLHLAKAQEMIRTAVKLKPNDGYIVDSLGWVYYQLGKYMDAVKELERAVELRPEDPIINDHLGDAYWRIGRKLEASFQWKHALSLDPEPNLIDKIKAKLENGLTEAARTLPMAPPKNSTAPGNEG